MAEYRPVPDDRAPDFRRIAQYAFDAASGPHDPEESLDERRERMWNFGEERGLFDGEDLLVVCSHFPFTVRVRGTRLPMGGVSAVASPPERRRQGLVGELLAASLAEYRERGWPLAALYPFDEEFYARYGWTTGCRRHVATVDVDALADTQDAAAGSFRRVRPAEAADELDGAFESWLEGRPLATERSDDWWRDRVFQTSGSELYGYAWERDRGPASVASGTSSDESHESDGEVRGYVVYEIDDGGDERTLETYEFAHADHEAYLNLLRFCHDHDSQVDAVELHGPDHGRLLDLVDDRHAVELEVASGAMVRIVDVPAALEAIEYPDAGDAALVLAVADDHAPWNDGTFEVGVRDGEATVTETDADPGATVDVGTLSQLYVGHLSAGRARQVGGLCVETADATATLAALFPEREPFLPEGF